MSSGLFSLDFYYVGVVVLVAMTTKETIAKKVQRWLECVRCGHGWFSALPRPVVCPRCKSYSWDEKPKRRRG